jgi:hypothetical protein
MINSNNFVKGEIVTALEYHFIVGEGINIVFKNRTGQRIWLEYTLFKKWFKLIEEEN